MATKSLGLLTLDLVAKIGGYVGPLDKADRETKRRMNNISGYMKNVAIASAAVGTAAVAGLAVLVKNSASAAREIDILSNVANTNVEQFQRLAYASRFYGVEQDKLADILKDTSDRVGDFLTTGAGPMADFFEKVAPKIGVTAEQFRNLSGADALQLYIESLEKANLTQNEMIFYMEAIAGDSARLIPLFRDNGRELGRLGDEAERLGLVVGGETVDALTEFDKNLTRLSAVTTGLGNKIAANIAEPLVDLTDTLADPKTQEGLSSLVSAMVTLTGLAVEGASEFAELGDRIAFTIANITGQIDDVTKLEEEIRAIDDALGAGAFTRPIKWLLTSDEELRAIREQKSALLEVLTGFKSDPLAAMSKSLDDLIDKSGLFFENISGGDLGVDTSAIDERLKKLSEDRNAEFAKTVQSLREQIALTGDINELDEIRYQLAEGGMSDFTESQKVLVEQLATELVAKKELARIDEERAAAELQLSNDLETVRNQLLSQEERLQEAAQERFQTIEKAFLAGKLSEEEFARMAAESTELLEQQIDALKDKTDELDEFTKAAAESIQNELSNALVAGFDGGSEDILERWGDLLKRMVADAVAADLTRALFGQTAGDSDFGTAQLVTGIGNLFAGFFDAGGNIPAGQFGIVGEYGPELVSGPATITGRKDTADMLGGSSVSIGQMVFPGVTNAREAELAAGAAGRRISRIIAGSQRYN